MSKAAFDQKFLEIQQQRLLKRRKEHREIFQSLGPGELDPYAANKARVIAHRVAIASERLEAGTYGICVDCNEEIPIRRLELIPGAIRCIDCQERDEEYIRCHT